MKARKTASGKWNVQVLDYVDANGKMHKRSFTADTKTEAERLAMIFKCNRTEGGQDGMVEDMIERAIRAKESVLSPSTYRGYVKILRTTIKDTTFGTQRLSSLNSQRVQAWVTWMVGKGLSPKSVKNAYGLFTSCYQFYGGDKVFRVKLPQIKSQRKHVPSIADLHKILDYFATDPDMTAAVCLCAFASLRRGEVCALDASDVDRKRHTIYVHKALTLTMDNDWIEKEPKTASSVRVVPVSQFVLSKLPKKGKCVSITPHMITNRFGRAVEKLGLERFSFHDLRHFYASLAHNKGVSDITIQAAAGWSSSATMKDIYFGEINEETVRQTEKLNSFIDADFGR